MKYLLTILLLVLVSCNEIIDPEDDNSTNNEKDEQLYFEAEIIRNNIACEDVTFLKFLNNLDTLKSITGKDREIYETINIPDDLDIPEQKVKITIRQVKKGEHWICPAYDISYPPIWITSIEKVDE